MRALSAGGTPKKSVMSARLTARSVGARHDGIAVSLKKLSDYNLYRISNGYCFYAKSGGFPPKSFGWKPLRALWIVLRFCYLTASITAAPSAPANWAFSGVITRRPVFCSMRRASRRFCAQPPVKQMSPSSETRERRFAARCATESSRPSRLSFCRRLWRAGR